MSMYNEIYILFVLSLLMLLIIAVYLPLLWRVKMYLNTKNNVWKMYTRIIDHSFNAVTKTGS